MAEAFIAPSASDCSKNLRMQVEEDLSLWMYRFLLPRALHLLPVAVDVGDDDLDDDDEGNGEEHTCRAEDFTAEDNTEDDGDGVEVEAFADKGGIDDVVVDLR